MNGNDELDCCLYIEELRIRAMLGHCTLAEQYSECAVCARTEGPFEPHWWDGPPEDGDNPNTVNKVVQGVITVCPSCHRQMTRHAEELQQQMAGVRLMAEMLKASGARTIDEMVSGGNNFPANTNP